MITKTDDGGPTTDVNYIYDVSDQLIQVQDLNFNVIADYAYDPFGRRLWKQVDGQRIYYVYSDEGLIAEYDQQGSLIKTYGYRPNSQWTTDPLFQKIGDSYFWYKNDAQGTPQKIVDTSGRVVWEARYDAFGNCAVITQEIENNLRLAGQYYDKETGLYYNWHRYYDPVLGRYLQTDPYREGLNLYAYCHNNPNSFIDPMGLCLSKMAWGWLKTKGWTGLKGFYANLVRGFEDFNYMLYYGIVDPLLQILSLPSYLIELITGADAQEQMFIASCYAPAELAAAFANLPLRLRMLMGAGSGRAAAVAEEGMAGGVSGGRLGNQSTRQHVSDVATEMESRGYEITHGGGRSPEEYLSGPGGTQKGSSYPDITATKDGRTLRVNTVDTYADGVTPTSREAANAARIREQTGEHVLLVPKPKP